MEDLIEHLSVKAGIDRAVAEKISAVLHEHSAELPKLLAGDTEGLVQVLKKAGIEEGIAQKVLAVLKQNSANPQALLESESGGLLKKAKDVFGGILGRKEGE